MVREPVRDELPELAATEYPQFPLPLPLVPEVTAIQLAPLEALQEQPFGADTLTDPVPPVEVKGWLAGEMEKLQDVPDWFIERFARLS